jgi:Lrp/AsnC family transcriptional regulator for asnA, asnC and gidA
VSVTIRVDHTDRAIVDLLIEDGRMSGADIARRIGDVTERTVRNRLERLVREDVIRVTAVVNAAALGLPVTADVFVEVEPGHIMHVARRIAAFDCVTYVACSTGENDLSLQIVAEDNAGLYRFVTEVLANVPGVRKTTTVLLPIIVKDDNQWPIPAGRCAE